MSPEVYQDHRAILAGEVFYSSTNDYDGSTRETSPQDLRIFVEGQLLPVMLRLVCVPETSEFQPEQNMSGRLLMSHLYKHSRWIDDYFTFGREPSGDTPEIKFAEWGRLFSKEEIGTFDGELTSMPPPTGDNDLIRDFENLRVLIRTACREPGLSLLLSIV
jgi:hypothetical protein